NAGTILVADAASKVNITGTLTNNGHVQVNGGTLNASVAINNLSLNTLAGTGHIVAPTVTSSGGISPGDPAVNGGIGTLTFGTDTSPTPLTLQGGAHLSIQIAGAADLISVHGNLNLPSTVLPANTIAPDLTNAGATLPGVFRFLEYTGQLVGSIGNLQIANVP